MTRDEEMKALERKLAQSGRPGYGYTARVAAIKERLQTLKDEAEDAD